MGQRKKRGGGSYTTLSNLNWKEQGGEDGRGGDKEREIVINTFTCNRRDRSQSDVGIYVCVCLSGKKESESERKKRGEER